MTELLVIVIWILTLVLAGQVVLLCLELLAGASTYQPTCYRSVARPRLVILIPAHNEGARVDQVLSELLLQIGAGDRLMVVADNCTDDTALLASRFDVEVLEHDDDRRIGKGHALAKGLDRLRHGPFGLIGVMDADCRPSEGAVELLAQRAFQLQRPVQGLFLHDLPEDADAWSRFSCYTVRINNLVRQLGRTRLGIPAQMVGSGMFMPMDVAHRVDWASGYLAEDAELGLDLALCGCIPAFVPEAEVLTTAPVGNATTLAQRVRWLSGRFGLMFRRVAGAVVFGLVRGPSAAIAAALDLSILPASILFGLLLAGTSATAWLASRFGPAFTPFVILASCTCLFGLTQWLVWWMHGRHILSGRDSLRVPGMLLRQALATGRSLVQGKVRWEDHEDTDGCGR